MRVLGHTVASQTGGGSFAFDGLLPPSCGRFVTR